MPRLAPLPLQLNETEREQLQQLVNRYSTPQQIAIRASIIILADEGQNHREIARSLNISRDMARLWRQRWLELSQKDIPVAERLTDAERPGGPTTFSLEQILQLFAIACSKPEHYGRPISHWTARELASEVVKQGIVTSISPRYVGRLMVEADFVTAPVTVLVESPPDPQFDEKVQDICDSYLSAIDRAKQFERTVSIDEMTGIQALERKFPDQPMRPGFRERKEFEYIRHGTQTLIASFGSRPLQKCSNVA